MIRHVVMFRFLEEAQGRSRRENVLATRAMLDALPAKIPQILHSETHIGDEGAAEGNCHLLLISDFADERALEEYLVHPDHKAVGAFMRPLRESRAAIDFTV